MEADRDGSAIPGRASQSGLPACLTWALCRSIEAALRSSALKVLRLGPMGLTPRAYLKKIPSAGLPCPTPHCFSSSQLLQVRDGSSLAQHPLSLSQTETFEAPSMSPTSPVSVITFVTIPAFETVHRDVRLRVPCSFVRIPTLDLGPLSLWDGGGSKGGVWCLGRVLARSEVGHRSGHARSRRYPP